MYSQFIMHGQKNIKLWDHSLFVIHILHHTSVLPDRPIQMSHSHVGVPEGKGLQYTDFSLTDAQMMYNESHQFRFPQ